MRRAFLILAVAGCARPAPALLPDVTPAEWRLSRERLARARAAIPTRPYVETVRLALRDPRSGRELSARGALAVSPDRAARMVLVGPGGVTALDLWVTRDRFRFVVPGLRFEKRGGRNPDDARGLPVGFLRWWFLSPLRGRLLTARSSDEESAWLLKDDAATVMVRTDGRRFVAARHEGARSEGIEWIGSGLLPSAGVRGRYVDALYGVAVDVQIEEVMPNEPGPEAFADPDLEEGTP